MYAIYAEVNGYRVCLHDDTVTDETVKVIEPTLTLEDSAAGSLEFKLAPNNLGYATHTVTETMFSGTDGSAVTEVTKEVDVVGRMVSTITVYRNDGGSEEEIWEGRVLSEENDFWNCRKIYCEGELAYLNDTFQPEQTYHDITVRQYAQAMLNYHNQKVDSKKKFYIGIVELGDDQNTSYRYTQYEQTLSYFNTLIEELGGHIRVRKSGGKRYLDLLKEYPNDNTQEIRFGTNLLEFTRKYDMSELCTAVLPVGSVIENESGSASTVGDELPLYPYPANGASAGYATCYILSQENSQSEVIATYNSACTGYKTARVVVEPDTEYYISCRLHGGFVMYCMRGNSDGSGDYYSGYIKKAGTDLGFTDCVETKVKTPAGCHSILLCSFGDDVPLRVNKVRDTTSDPEETLDSYITVEDVNNDGTYHQKGSMYVINESAVTQYGWIERKLEFSDIEDAQTLYSSAKTYLTSGQFDELTLEMTAVDLTALGADAERIGLLDRVHVISEPHGLDKWLPVTKMELPLDNPANMQFTLGTSTEQSLTSANNTTNTDLLNRIAALPSFSKTLASAKANAAEMINNATNGYIIFVMDDDGNPKELLISSMKNYKDPSAKIWRWNMNGLAYSSAGYDLTQFNTNVAITADGSIVADLITAGELSGITIRGCEIIAGGMDGADGTITVKSGLSDGPYMQMQKGRILGGYVTHDSSGNEVLTEYGHMIFDLAVNQPDGSTHRGLRIRSPQIMILETDDLGVGNGSGSNTQTAVSGTYRIATHDGSNITLGSITFINGVCVQIVS